MKKTCLLVTYLVVLSGLNGQPAGFTQLFNEKDLSGWWGLGTEDPAKWMALPPAELEAKKNASLEDIHQHWTVKEGVLVNDGEGLYLTTESNYGDFELILEYKTMPLGDSGVYLRGIPQVQIWDYTEEAKFDRGADKGSGGLWNNKKSLDGKFPLVLADKPFGEWNKLRILMIGERVTVCLNDQLVVDHARMDNYFNPMLPIPPRGPIQLQTHGREISWRNIYIREIGSGEANRILSARCGIEGTTPTGWQGAVENYLIGNGSIQCCEGKGGVLFTKQQYGDFALSLEIKLPPGGNNGLAVRYPGAGDPAYSGMCELQVLDDSAPKYENLDTRQFHGSAYGMVAAHRGYQRPVGEWNFQAVEVRGSTIKVELNGTMILETDLSKVSDFLKGKAHPGKDLELGYFGFAGHDSPVSFRNITIKELNNESE